MSKQPRDDNVLMRIPSHRVRWSAVDQARFAPMMPTPTPCVTIGASVVLQVGEKDPQFTFVDKVVVGKSVRLGKANVAVDALLGVPFGSYFELDRNKLTLLDPAPLSEYFETKTAGTDRADEAINQLLTGQTL
jgi:hypothetical protein